MADQLVPDLDLVVWLDIPDVLATDRATEVLEVATGWVQAATRQKLLAVTDETVTLPLRPGRSVWLPERPVTAVGAVLTTDAYGVSTPRTLGVDYSVIGPEIRWAYWLNWPTSSITVTYSHGYLSAPQAIRGVVLSAASRIVNNPAGLRSETVGSVSWTNGGTGLEMSGGLTDGELRTLGPFMALAA